MKLILIGKINIFPKCSSDKPATHTHTRNTITHLVTYSDSHHVGMSFFSENSFDRLLTKRMFQTDTLKFRLSNVKNLSYKLTANQHMDSISLTLV